MTESAPLSPTYLHARLAVRVASEGRHVPAVLMQNKSLQESYSFYLAQVKNDVAEVKQFKIAALNDKKVYCQ